MTREINFTWGTVRLDGAWRESDLLVALDDKGHPVEPQRLNTLEERIFEGVHVRPHIEHPLRFESLLQVWISNSLTLSKRAGILVPASDIDRPCSISPLHVASTEPFDILGPPFATVVLYGWRKVGGW